ncbi:MAG TPA: tyrosine-type recombinase/integrase [Candidatus Dorea faecigallinarum]|nr:tyrosine-type recombinase/integrase [Candidatus Dorea faecigallinarum]
MAYITFCIKENDLIDFKQYLQERENSTATIEKYLRDVRKFIVFSGRNAEVDKELLLSYKEWLIQNYTVSSVNSMLVALNQFLTFREMGRLRLKQVKVQRSDVMGQEKVLEKKEFQSLVYTAREQGKEQIAMIMETICATGIRISELKFFRVENIRTGMVKVWNKGKHRIVLIPDMLKKKLLIYIGRNQIRTGVIFCTRSGRPKNRSNIWKEMKRIAELAGVSLKKVFPHNLRHLFARVFYRKTKNLINLADILGHSNLDVTRIYATDGIREWKKNIEQMRILETT